MGDASSIDPYFLSIDFKNMLLSADATGLMKEVTV